MITALCTLVGVGEVIGTLYYLKLRHICHKEGW